VIVVNGFRKVDNTTPVIGTVPGRRGRGGMEGQNVTNKYKHPKWQKTRLRIMERDAWKCVACLDESSTLCVHHKRYSRTLWGVSDDDLQTLCESCHSLLGPHPKAGVWWERTSDHAYIVVQWCPVCGSKSWKDKGSYDKCMECSFETDLYLDVGGYSLRGVTAEAGQVQTPSEPHTTILPSWDKEVLGCLVDLPCVAEIVISGVDLADLGSREGRAVLDAARRLRADGRPFGLQDLLSELPDQNIQSILVSIHDRVAEDQTNSADRMEWITDALRRRAATSMAEAAAQSLKTSRLDAASEAALLEVLVAQRRVSQGMDKQKQNEVDCGR